MRQKAIKGYSINKSYKSTCKLRERCFRVFEYCLQHDSVWFSFYILLHTIVRDICMGKMVCFSSQTPKWDLPAERVIQQKPLLRPIEADTIKYMQTDWSK